MLYLFVILVMFTNTHRLSADDRATQLIDAISSVEKANNAIKETGTIEKPCTNCLKQDFDKSYFMSSKDLVIDTPFYMSEKKPYIVHLKRNKDTPSKIKVKFKNGHRECGKIVAYTSPYSGSLNFDCLFYTTIYEEQILEFNFSELGIFTENEDQVIELKFFKENLDRAKYSIDVNALNGKELSIKKDKKLFNNGLNLKFSEAKKNE